MTKPLALVTGASRGIGKTVACRLANEGYRVIGTATSEAGAAAIRDDLKLIDQDNDAMILDISHPEGCEETLKELLNQFGTPAVVVNNAGVTRDNLLLRMSADHWDEVINTNLSGVFRVCKQLAKPMLKNKSGRIINISSVIGSTGNSGQSNYSAAKAGLEAFSRSLAQEIAARNITVNCIAPGFIETDMTDSLPESQKEAILATIPSKRLGKTDDIAGAVVFLAGEDAQYITGQVLHVNGGMYMGG